MSCKHCVKCHSFAWLNGDYCCTMRMSIMESSPDGKYISPLPIAFDAKKCEYYDERENYDSEVHNYYGGYIDFLSKYYKLPSIDDKEKILEELGYIGLKKK